MVAILDSRHGRIIVMVHARAVVLQEGVGFQSLTSFV